MDWLLLASVYFLLALMGLVLVWISPFWFVAMCIISIVKVKRYQRDWARNNVLASIAVVLLFGFLYGFNVSLYARVLVPALVLSIPFLAVFFFTRNVQLHIVSIICPPALAMSVIMLSYFMPGSSFDTDRRIKKEEAAIPALARASRDYFDEQCKKSGYFVYKEIEKPQKSVAILGDDHHDYFLDNEIYEAQKSAEKAQGKYIEYFKASMSDSYQRELERLFWHENNQSSFLFVEAVHHKNGEATRYSPETMKSHQNISINIPQSRYGYVWRDVTTQEDIEHWVTKNRLKVIDLKKDEVVAERIAYTLSRYPGMTNWYVREKTSPSHSTFNSNSEAVYCPYNMRERDADWIKSLLLGTPFF